MQLISIPVHDSTLAAVQQRAAREGFPSPAAYIGNWFEENFNPPPENMDEFFTPQIMAEVKAAALESKGVKGISADEMRAEIQAKSAAWRTNESR